MKSRSDRASDVWTRRVEFSPVTVLVSGLVLGSVLRLIQIATSIGSVDVVYWMRHVNAVETYGSLRAYLASTFVNHPPFGLEVARWTYRAGSVVGLRFHDSFRLLQSLADLGTALVLWRLAPAVGRSGTWAALLFYLSPAAIFVSAFHCNSDPLMVFFLTLSVLLVIRKRPVLAGMAIGAAVGIKIIALAVAPLLLLAWVDGRARRRFLLTALATGAVIFVPGLIASGWVMVRNVFGYTGWKGGWGFILLSRLLDRFLPGNFPGDPTRLLVPALILSMVALWGAEAWWSRRHGLAANRLPQTAGVAYLLILFLATGFMPYYLIWVLPFVAFLFTRRGALLMHTLISAYLFALYTSWAHEWPWVYAEGGRGAISPAVGLFGLAVWAVLGSAAVWLLRELYLARSREKTLQPET